MATATVGSFTVVASTITEGVSPVSSTLGRPEHGKHFTHTRLQGLNIRSSLWYRQNVNKAQVASASSPLVQVSVIVLRTCLSSIPNIPLAAALS